MTESNKMETEFFTLFAVVSNYYRWYTKQPFVIESKEVFYVAVIF